MLACRQESLTNFQNIHSCQKCANAHFQRHELGSVISSDLFNQDEYIKQYLLDPDLSLISKIKIGLRDYITDQPELILQLNVFKDYIEKINPFLFLEVFGKYRKERKIW